MNIALYIKSHLIQFTLMKAPFAFKPSLIPIVRIAHRSSRSLVTNILEKLQNFYELPVFYLFVFSQTHAMITIRDQSICCWTPSSCQCASMSHGLYAVFVKLQIKLIRLV